MKKDFSNEVVTVQSQKATQIAINALDKGNRTFENEELKTEALEEYIAIHGLMDLSEDRLNTMYETGKV